jgi:SAM-dependent methyltransferase
MWLLSQNLLSGKILDFGCGRGMDMKYLKSQNRDIDGYDPNFRPDKKYARSTYDTIVCFYVLNVVDEKTEVKVLQEIRKVLKKGGVAYAAVRRDLPPEGRQGRGCWQRWVKCPSGWTVLQENSSYAIFKYEDKSQGGGGGSSGGSGGSSGSGKDKPKK